MAQIGDTFTIGQICPESGVYRLRDSACTQNVTCNSQAQLEIPLAKGNRFPPCRTCKGTVTWELIIKA